MISKILVIPYLQFSFHSTTLTILHGIVSSGKINTELSLISCPYHMDETWRLQCKTKFCWIFFPLLVYSVRAEIATWLIILLAL